MKKTISLVLAVLMLASAFFALPAVSAEMKNPDVKGSNQELLDMLNNLVRHHRQWRAVVFFIALFAA